MKRVAAAEPPQETSLPSRRTDEPSSRSPGALLADRWSTRMDLDQVLHLRKRRLALKNEMRALYGTLKKAKSLDPDRFKEHEVVVRELTTSASCPSAGEEGRI